MIKYIMYYGFCIMLVFSFSGCNDFVRTEVENEIYVNQKSISGFIGDQAQLVASPTDVGYEFKWSSENNEIATVSSSGLVTLIAPGSTNIIVTAGTIKNRVEVNAAVRIPVDDVILSESVLILSPGDKKSVTFQRLPQEANDIPTPKWTSENVQIATVNERGEINAVAVGITNIVFQLGDIEKKVIVDVSATKAFNGPHNLVRGAIYELKAADFDFGGQGFAFNDDAANPIGNDNYRRSKGDANSFAVEVEGDGGNNLGFVNTGEWLQYTVNALEAGDYLMDLSLSGHANGKYYIEVNNVKVTESIPVPANGSWSNWTNYPSTPFTVSLNKGLNKVKVVIEQSGFNFKSLRFYLPN